MSFAQNVPMFENIQYQNQMIKPVPNASLADARKWSDEELAHWKHVAATVKVEKPE